MQNATSRVNKLGKIFKKNLKERRKKKMKENDSILPSLYHLLEHNHFAKKSIHVLHVNSQVRQHGCKTFCPTFSSSFFKKEIEIT